MNSVNCMKVLGVKEAELEHIKQALDEKTEEMNEMRKFEVDLVWADDPKYSRG